MKKLIGIFDANKMTPDEIFEKAQATLQKKERLSLIEMAKKARRKSK